MAKNLSVWYRMFIVFAVLWTIVSVTLLYLFFPFPKEIKERIEKLRDIQFLLAEAESEKEELGLVYSDIPGDPKQRIERSHKRQIERDFERRIVRHPKRRIERRGRKQRMELARILRMEADRKQRIEGDYKQRIYEYHKNRKNVIYLFPLYWLVPVGLFYGTGWCVGWIIRVFRKDRE